jgi:hypothetical protein
MHQRLMKINKKTESKSSMTLTDPIHVNQYKGKIFKMEVNGSGYFNWGD